MTRLLKSSTWTTSLWNKNVLGERTKRQFTTLVSCLYSSRLRSNVCFLESLGWIVLGFEWLIHSCEDHFHLYALSAVHIYDLYHMHIISFSSYNRYKLNLLLTCFQWGFIAQLVEHHTGITEVMGSNPVGVLGFFWTFFATAFKSCFFLDFLCNCF